MPTDEELKAQKEAEEKAKKEAEDKARKEAFLKARERDEEDDYEEDDDVDERLERLRKRKRKARREKDFLDEMFAPVKELLDEWTEYKTENNWSPKSKRAPKSPEPEVKPPEKKSHPIFEGFSGKGGLWDL